MPGKRPKQPARKKHLSGIQPKFTKGAWHWRARLKRHGQQQVGPNRRTQEEAHADYLAMRAESFKADIERERETLLHGALDEQLEKRRERKLSDTYSRVNLARYVRYLKEAWPNPETTLEGIDREAVEAYQQFALGQGRGPDPVNKEVSFLRDAFESAGVPFPRGVKRLRVPKAVMTYLTPDELIEMAHEMEDWKPRRKMPAAQEWVRHRDVAIAKLLGMTGIRAGEFLRLRVDDIDVERRELKIDNRKDGGQLQIQTYGEALDESIAFLIEHAQPNGALISSKAAYDGIWRRWRPRLSKKFVHGRTLRHSEGTRVLMDTGNLAVVQQRLRHSSVTTTAVYVHAAQQEIRKGNEAADRRWAEAARRRASNEPSASQEAEEDQPSDP